MRDVVCRLCRLQTRSIMRDYGSSVATRGILYSNTRQTSVGFRPLHKPNWLLVNRTVRTFSICLQLIAVIAEPRISIHETDVCFLAASAPGKLSGCSVSVQELLFDARKSADWPAAIPLQNQQPSQEPRYTTSGSLGLLGLLGFLDYRFSTACVWGHFMLARFC